MLFSVDVYTVLVQEGKFTMLNGPQTHTGLHECHLMAHWQYTMYGIASENSDMREDSEESS